MGIVGVCTCVPAVGGYVLNLKQLPTHPQNPGLVVVGFGVAVWADANPMIVRVKAATATKATIIFHFCMIFYLPFHF